MKQNHLHWQWTKDGNKGLNDVPGLRMDFFFFSLTMKTWDRRPAHAPMCPWCLRDGGLVERRGDDGQTSRKQRVRRDGQYDTTNALLISSMKNVHNSSKSTVYCTSHLHSTTTAMESLAYFYISMIHDSLMGKLRWDITLFLYQISELFLNTFFRIYT